MVYADGSGNGFRFEAAGGGEAVRFETTPVTPETSSSGTYSGGEARKGTLTRDAAADLWTRVGALEADAEIRAERREMGTGRFTLTTADAQRTFMVRRGDALAAFDLFVAGLIR